MSSRVHSHILHNVTVNNDQRMEEDVLAWISVIWISAGNTRSSETLADAARG